MCSQTAVADRDIDSQLSNLKGRVYAVAGVVAFMVSLIVGVLGVVVKL